MKLRLTNLNRTFHNPLQDSMHPWGTDSILVKTAHLLVDVITNKPLRPERQVGVSNANGFLCEDVRVRGFKLIGEKNE